MADISDSEIFDSLTSGNGKIEIDPTPAPVVEPVVTRDDSGRFAAKQEAPAVVEPPVSEAVVAPNEGEPKHGVPLSAMEGERQRRKSAEADAEALRREIAELRGMVQAVRQPAPQPQQEKQPPSMFEDPDAYLQAQLSPVQQQLQEMREEVWESRAAVVHTQAAIDAAKEAANALAGTPQGQALHQQITAGGNPFDNLVKWHKQQQAYAKVGSDPDAWLNSEIEKLKASPEFQAEVLAMARAGTQSPGSRQQPVTNIPPSLSKLPSGGNAPPAGDTSDAALFSSVTSSRRG